MITFTRQVANFLGVSKKLRVVVTWSSEGDVKIADVCRLCAPKEGYFYVPRVWERPVDFGLSFPKSWWLQL